jgi:hypothetical protein
MRKCLVPFAALAAAISLSACVVVDSSPPPGNRSGGGAVELEVYNGSSDFIYYIYVSPADAQAWGPDLLDIDVLAPGESTYITLDRGTWDIKCVDDSGGELVMWDQVINNDSRLTVTDGGSGPRQSSGTTRVDVTNDSHLYIYYIYVSPASDESWGPDILELDVLAPGETTSVSIQSGSWDIKCVAEDGQEVVFWDEFITDGLSITITTE